MSPNGFNGASHLQLDTSHHPYRSSIHRNGGEERGSISGSDDGNYPSYTDAIKYEVDVEDENAALISQTLNTDGTPKRPMNAFMIFARRRRPQVSSENQAMRTGEISKILSKEWNAMPPAEKQFYQDQARQLKDTFNSKYPDYVYRRRPNHSRRPRRKHDGGDPQNSSSTSDDFGPDDSSESPTDTRDQKGLDHFSNLHRTMSTGAGEHHDMPKFAFGNRTEYTYPNPASSFHSNDQSAKSYGSHSLESGPASLPAMSSLSVNTQSRPSSMYNAENNTSNGSWGLPSVRPSSSSSSWIGGDVNRNYQSIGIHKSPSFNSGWPRPPSSLSGSSTSNYAIPQLMGTEAQHDSSTPHSSTAAYAGNGMPTSAFYSSRHYDNHGQNIMTTSTNPSGQYQNGSFRDTASYLNRNASQELPSISNYSMHSAAHSATTNIHGNWTRD